MRTSRRAIRQRMGRPSIPPSQLAKVLLLQYRTGASDEQAMECVAWDLRWKIALGLAVDHQGWHPTSLTKFRARLLLHGSERVALERTLELARGAGDARRAGRADHRLDADARRGRHAGHGPAGPSRRQEAARRGRRGRRRGGGAAGSRRWSSTTRARTTSRTAAGARRPSASGCSPGSPQDAERALQAVEQADGLLDDEAVDDAHRLLRELIGQDFDIDDDGVPRLHRGTRADRIISTVDPEMRHGRKSQHQRFDGYKLSAAVTNTRGAADHRGRCRARFRAGRAAGQAPHRRPAARAAAAAGARRHRLRDRAGPRRAGRARRRGARAGAAGQHQARAPGQARLHGRPRRRHGHLPGRPDRADPHRAQGTAPRALRQGAPATAARCAIAASSRPAAPSRPARARRRAADRRPPSAR